MNNQIYKYVFRIVYIYSNKDSYIDIYNSYNNTISFNITIQYNLRWNSKMTHSL